jgi:S-formylglutathione hydrolase FrmB
MHEKSKLLFCSIVFLIFCVTGNGQKFTVKYTTHGAVSFTGNVYLYMSKDNKNPKDGNIGLESFPLYRISVKNGRPNHPVIFDDAAVGFPTHLSDIERGEYYVQAVWDRNLGGRSIANSLGNMYSKPIRVRLTKDYSKSFSISCDSLIPEQTFIETAVCKEIKVQSKLLTAFLGRPTSIAAAVVLPPDYDTKPEQKFPVLYTVFGYGGDYHRLSGSTRPASLMDTTSCIKVMLDGNCPLGHSVYANSENNGPWGDALTKELIPAIEKRFRCNSARLLTGHSSGGWTVLWLQTQYPSVFAACWSSSPDPVDFRSFQQINLYADKNMFYKTDSTLRLVATIAGIIPWATMKLVYQMENVNLRGEQMHSFDAVFSQKNKDGNPRSICDAKTGMIDPITVDHWKHYDISLNLRTNWNKLQSALQGKVRVTVGNQDNFLLNYPVHLLDDEMKKMQSDFIFAYYPGDHFTVGTPEYFKDGYKFLEGKYNEFINRNGALIDR